MFPTVTSVHVLPSVLGLRHSIPRAALGWAAGLTNEIPGQLQLRDQTDWSQGSLWDFIPINCSKLGTTSNALNVYSALRELGPKLGGTGSGSRAARL